MLNSQNNTELNIQDKNRPLFSFIIFNWFPWFFFSEEYQLSQLGILWQLCEHMKAPLFSSFCSLLLCLLSSGFSFLYFGFSSSRRGLLWRMRQAVVEFCFPTDFLSMFSHLEHWRKARSFVTWKNVFWMLATCRRPHANHRTYIGTFCNS